MTPAPDAEPLDHLALLPGVVDGLLAAAVDVDLAAPVPGCPGWDLAALLDHLGGTYRWAEAMLRSGRAEHLRPRDVVPPPGPDPRTWVRTSADSLLDALTTTAPDAPVWTFGPRPVAAFWRRRLLHESAVHAADVALAGAREPEVPRPVAVDGVAEHLEVVPRNPGVVRRAAGSAPAAPVLLDLVAADGPERWRVRWDGTGSSLVAAGRATGPTEGAAPDAVVRGPVVALLLALWRRPAPVEVSGDAAAWHRWSQAHAL
ncbi:maleylpyruvate isomerase N-terminal domain-containing protein [Pseudokineococcus basanitobsidens]|uniref:Maleylpyruvate isomerase N-terminal domain-containing protein n=1 Tax=Pseudokineococcus basanitobsidens TaxID=1926649 RepID=A0ABU8RMB3_9ACTN